MSKSGNTEYPENNVDQEDVQWFQNYEKRNKTKYFEKLKKKDMLNYIKDIEQKCRLELSSDDEDYASTTKSSTCSPKCSIGTKSKLLKKNKSKVTSKKNTNLTLKKKKEKKKQSFNHDVTNACNYCCLAQKSHFHNNFNHNVQKNSEKNLYTFTKVLPRNKFVYQNPNLSRNSYKYRKSSLPFSEWYSKKNYRTYPAVTKIVSFDVIKDSSQNAAHDFKIKRSNIPNSKSAESYAFESPRGNKFDSSRYISTCPSTNEKMKGINLSCYSYKRETETQMRKLNKESSDSDFENQQPVDKIYSDRDATFSYQAPLPKRSYKGCYTARYRYPLKKFRQPTSWSLSSRSNRLTELERLPETSSLLLQTSTSQWENEIELPLKAPSYVMEASIDQRETNRKNNMDQRRRRAAVLGDRESLCYRNSGLLRQFRKLYPEKVAPTREDKQWLGCYCDERDEATDCPRYCCCEKMLEKPPSGDSSGSRYDAAEPTCECKEPFHDPPAACLTGSCTCVENMEKNNSDSTRETPDTVYRCCCFSCSSSTFHNEKDPVKKLESFCEKVKAVNQDIFHKPSKFTCRNITRTNSRKYVRIDSDEQNQYEFNAEKGIRGVKSTGRKWLTDFSRLRLEKLERSHGGENLEKILIYPPRGEGGPPLTLYKRSSNISCRVKGDADTGFSYNVIYVQKFVSPKWMPRLSPEIPSRDKKCNCSADYG